MAENFFGDCPEHTIAVQSPSLTTTDKENDIMANDKKRPVEEVRIGRIRAAIWENQTEQGVRHNVTVSRLYKDGNDWKDTGSFGREDLLLVAKVMDQAHTWIYEHANGSAGGDSGQEENF